MILQALNQYYDRLKEDPQANIPQNGFGRRPISFALVIDRAGKLIHVRDIREKREQRLLPVLLTVPQTKRKRSNDILPYFMWDNTGYVLGVDAKGMHRTRYFQAFKNLHHALGDSLNDPGMIAVLRFLDSWNPTHARSLEYWKEMIGANLVFQLDGEHIYIHDHSDVQQTWIKQSAQEASKVIDTCLVNGAVAPIARLHPFIKGVQGAQSSGACIVSFNLGAFRSYNKKQNFNAPVGESAAFAYTTALNHLLRFDSQRKISIGDATTVFWTEQASPVEGFMRIVFDLWNKDSDPSGIRHYLAIARDGKSLPAIYDPDLRFHVLGLSPNASRISVRFWYVSTVADISEKIGLHFQDLAIVRSERDPEFPGIRQLLRETAVQGKTENINPLLAGAIMRSMLTGKAYPQSLLSTLLRRIRADQNICYLRAAMIKAYFNRKYRIHEQIKEFKMYLDKESTHIAYRLGRLFAVLEKTHKDAIPGATTTLKDRFYNSASVTPSGVFPKIFRLAQYHLQKAGYGGRMDKLIEEIMHGIGIFPIHLSLDEQGIFAIGYYHQRRALYGKSENQHDGEHDA